MAQQHESSLENDGRLQENVLTIHTSSNVISSTSATILNALATLGAAPLDESTISRHVFPLFSRVLARDAEEIYLANHSLGRPLDATSADVSEGISLWYTHMDKAWTPWWEEMTAWRTATAKLVNVPCADCIVPKSNAGQGLRSVLNSFNTTPRVLTTSGEFDSIDHILKQYTTTSHATIKWVTPREDGHFYVDDLIAQLDSIDLVVVSHVFFASGQVLTELPRLVSAVHHAGAYILLDVYHSYGVLPLDLTTLGVDYAVAGSYKYLRGGPGVSWLYVAPEVLKTNRTTRDTGWFAKKDPFSYERSSRPLLAVGGNSWLESTFSPFGFYQSRAGLVFVTAIGVTRLRAWSLIQKRCLAAALRRHNVICFGEGEDFGAFLTVPHDDPAALATRLKIAGVNADARAVGLRLCPDVLNTAMQLERAAEIVAKHI